MSALIRKQFIKYSILNCLPKLHKFRHTVLAALLFANVRHVIIFVANSLGSCTRVYCAVVFFRRRFLKRTELVFAFSIWCVPHVSLRLRRQPYSSLLNVYRTDQSCIHIDIFRCGDVALVLCVAICIHYKRIRYTEANHTYLYGKVLAFIVVFVVLSYLGPVVKPRRK